MAKEQGPNIKVLKAVVTTLGLLIVLSLGIVAYGVARKFTGPPETAAVTAAATAVAQPAEFGDVRIDIPPGARLAVSETVGNRLLLHFDMADGSRRIVVIDLASGRRLGTLLVAPPEQN